MKIPDDPVSLDEELRGSERNLNSEGVQFDKA